MRRKIYKCCACGSEYCTVRTCRDEKPSKCIYWKDCAEWLRIDKHEQKEIGEYQ